MPFFFHTARARTDPHMVTFDGHPYTFNGKGEFVLVETPDETFSLQGRMLPITTAQNTESEATVYKAIVGKQNNSDTVQFEIIDDCGFIALVNGEQVIFGLINQQEFNNVVVSYLGNNTFSASFSSGAYVEAKEEVGIISVVSVSLPPSFEGNGTRGLMGSFNGNITDDLLPNSGQEPLSLNSSVREIHELFGITCEFTLYVKNKPVYFPPTHRDRGQSSGQSFHLPTRRKLGYLLRSLLRSHLHASVLHSCSGAAGECPLRG